MYQYYVTPCGLVDRYQNFGVACLSVQNITVISSVLKMEEAGSSETLMTIHQTTRLHMPETSVHSQHRGNLKSHIFWTGLLL